MNIPFLGASYTGYAEFVVGDLCTHNQLVTSFQALEGWGLSAASSVYEPGCKPLHV